MLPACKSATYLIIGHLKRLWEQALVVAAVANQDALSDVGVYSGDMYALCEQHICQIHNHQALTVAAVSRCD